MGNTDSFIVKGPHKTIEYEPEEFPPAINYYFQQTHINPKGANTKNTSTWENMHIFKETKQQVGNEEKGLLLAAINRNANMKFHGNRVGYTTPAGMRDKMNKT